MEDFSQEGHAAAVSRDLATHYAESTLVLDAEAYPLLSLRNSRFMMNSSEFFRILALSAAYFALRAVSVAWHATRPAVNDWNYQFAHQIF